MGSSAGVGWQVRKRPSFGNGNRIRYKKSLAASRKSCSSKRAQQSKCRVDLKIAKPLVHSGDEAYALEAQLHRTSTYQNEFSRQHHFSFDRNALYRGSSSGLFHPIRSNRLDRLG